MEGGCLCGAIRYRVDSGRPSKATFCHCRMCQRSAGAPVMPWFGVPLTKFTLLSGGPAAYQSSQNARREFCPTCGTQLFFREKDDSSIDIATASLDEPSLVRPQYHIWFTSRTPWFDTSDHLPRYTEGRET
jgi:hypothetical protein